jgi:hypothetical protein
MYINIIIIIMSVFLSYIHFNKNNLEKKLYNKLRDYELNNNRKIIIIINESYDKDTSISKLLNNYLIPIDDNMKFMECIKNTDYDELDIIINSIGGDIFSCDSIVNILLSYKGIKTAYIPYYAFSAASVIAFSCDKMYIDKFAQLGPVDPQISVSLNNDSDEEYIPVKTLIKMNRRGVLNKELMISYYEGKLLYDDGIRMFKKILGNKYEPKIKNKMVNEFCSGKYPHSRPFNVADLRNMGLNFNTNIPKDINQISILLLKILKSLDI